MDVLLEVVEHVWRNGHNLKPAESSSFGFFLFSFFNSVDPRSIKMTVFLCFCDLNVTQFLPLVLCKHYWKDFDFCSFLFWGTKCPVMCAYFPNILIFQLFHSKTELFLELNENVNIHFFPLNCFKLCCKFLSLSGSNRGHHFYFCISV